MQQIRTLLDKLEEDNIHNLLDTVCMIDECNRIDKMFERCLRKEGIDIKEFEIDEEIEVMILGDIEYWDNVYQELEDYFYDDDWYDDDLI